VAVTRRRWRDLAFLVALPLYVVALFASTHVPHVRIPGQIPQSDKVLHFTAFAILAFLAWQFQRARGRPPGPRFVWVAGPILIAYAALDELTQDLVGRWTDPVDFAANAAGIVTVLTVLELRRRWRARRR
jgi:TRAP-type uncharacterized transport system fused permease subunit